MCDCKYGVFAGIGLFLLILVPGCGVKQDNTPVLTMDYTPKIHNAASDDLSRHEKEAFRTVGQIDKNVPEEALSDIEQEYRYFLREGRKTMCSFSKRSEPYLAYARQVFKNRGMPEELANLAIVESGYRANAVSSAGAAGAWQFMPFTGEKYGLKQDFWQDERLDPYRSTEAAADYLQKLYNDFGDWPTAVAAYNAGEGKMSRAKEGTGGANFFEVKALNHVLDDKAQLRVETQKYVPRFMAVTKIMRNLPKLGFEPISPENSAPVIRFQANPGTDLAALSRACNMSWEEFRSYNLHHKRAITCTDKVTNIYLPEKSRLAAAKFLCTSESAGFAGWKPVQVRNKRDSLEKISKRTRVPLAKLKIANPGLATLRAGQTVLVPGALDLSRFMIADSGNNKKARSEVSSKNNLSQAQKGGNKNHILKANETLFSVAKKYNIDLKNLMAHNKIDDPGRLRPGHVLAIPPNMNESGPITGKSSGRIGKKVNKATYVVQDKDNLWKIARKHNVSVEELKRWNKLGEKSIKPGISLVVEN